MKEFNRFSKDERHKFRGNHKIGFADTFVDTQELVPVFSKLFDSMADVEWAVREATSDGPNHKQLRNALILKQVALLVKKLALTETVDSNPIIGTSPKEYNFEYPIGIPKNVYNFIVNNVEDAEKWLGEGPYHEVAFDLLLMSCLAALNKRVEALAESTEK